MHSLSHLSLSLPLMCAHKHMWKSVEILRSFPQTLMVDKFESGVSDVYNRGNELATEKCRLDVGFKGVRFDARSGYTCEDPRS